jgi:uncharacterized protein YmfQ (DUF2313 family)
MRTTAACDFYIRFTTTRNYRIRITVVATCEYRIRIATATAAARDYRIRIIATTAAAATYRLHSVEKRVLIRVGRDVVNPYARVISEQPC